VAYRERAPALYELDANGPHDPTRPYLIGIPNAQREKAVSTHLSLRFASGSNKGAASVCSRADS
jgi:iron complex outermembrane receptor protein